MIYRGYVNIKFVTFFLIYEFTFMYLLQVIYIEC